jgi:ubiquinone/menaquinone biosynthesis C-methylase UbiE
LTAANKRVSQCQKPSGPLGRFVLWMMNARHSKFTDWGLSHVPVEKHYTILDAGCGGGRTVSKLAAAASAGKVYGVDYAKASVATATRINKESIDQGRVEIRKASVLQLPFPENAFDLVTAVETHFWWENLPGALREVLRVLKPGGTVLIIAEIYKGADTKVAKLAEKHLPLSGMAMLTVDEHRDLLSNGGFSDIQIATESRKGWICCMAKKPA